MKDAKALTPNQLSMSAFRDACRERSDEALDKITQIMRKGSTSSVQLQAAIYIIDRGFGKPVQSAELTGKDGERLFDGWSSDQIRDEVRRRLTDPGVLRSLGIDGDLLGGIPPRTN